MHHPYSRRPHTHPWSRQYCESHDSHSGMNMDACRLLNLPLRPFTDGPGLYAWQALMSWAFARLAAPAC